MEFSKTARYYHLLEDIFIGRALQQTRVFPIESAALNSNRDRVLIVGEGNGRFLRSLLERFPDLRVTVIEESSTMIDLAQQRLQRAGLSCANVDFICADLGDVSLPYADYTLIVTHFFFSNFSEEEVRAMIRQLSSAAEGNATWWIGDFVMPEYGWKRLRAKVWLWILYRFFGQIEGVRTRQVPEVSVYLGLEGFQLADRVSFSGELLASKILKRS